MKLQAKDINGESRTVYFGVEDVQQMKLTTNATYLLIFSGWYEITEEIDLDEFHHYVETKNDLPMEFELEEGEE